MTELEEQLASDGGESVRRQVADLLGGEQAKVKAMLDRGMTPAEFTIYKKYFDALTAAAEVLDSPLP